MTIILIYIFKKFQRTTLRHTVIKILKNRRSKVEKRLVTHKGATIRLTADFFLEITESRGNGMTLRC